MVYNPLETVLVQRAREQGKTVVPGLEMFIEQAVRQFEIWTGETAPRAADAEGRASKRLEQKAMKITRRKLAAASGRTAGRPAAQTPPSLSHRRRTDKSRATASRPTREALAKASIPMATEPAFQFKA